MTDTTAAPARRILRYVVLAAVAVLAVAAGIVFFIVKASGPAPVDYKITATGAGTAMWITPDGSGQIDMTAGTGTQTVHAGKVSVTVTSTAADGASCQIIAPDGKVVDTQTTSSGATSVTCATP